MGHRLWGKDLIHRGKQLCIIILLLFLSVICAIGTCLASSSSSKWELSTCRVRIFINNSRKTQKVLLHCFEFPSFWPFTGISGTCLNHILTVVTRAANGTARLGTAKTRRLGAKNPAARPLHCTLIDAQGTAARASDFTFAALAGLGTLRTEASFGERVVRVGRRGAKAEDGSTARG